MTPITTRFNGVRLLTFPRSDSNCVADQQLTKTLSDFLAGDELATSVRGRDLARICGIHHEAQTHTHANNESAKKHHLSKDGSHDSIEALRL